MPGHDRLVLLRQDCRTHSCADDGICRPECWRRFDDPWEPLAVHVARWLNTRGRENRWGDVCDGGICVFPRQHTCPRSEQDAFGFVVGADSRRRLPDGLTIQLTGDSIVRVYE